MFQKNLFSFYLKQAEVWNWYVCHSLLMLDLPCYETLGNIYILLHLWRGKRNVKMLSLLEKPLNSMALLCVSVKLVFSSRPQF